MSVREMVAGLRQAEHTLRFLAMHQAAAACLAAIDFLEEVR